MFRTEGFKRYFMKQNPVLFAALLFTLLIEFIVITITYINIGPERMTVQGIRVFLQVLVILSILTHSKRGLFLLVAYHIIIGLDAFVLRDLSNLFVLALGVYHIIIGLIIYFHDYIEENILKIKTINHE